MDISEDLRWDLAKSPFASVLPTNYVPSTEDLIHLAFRSSYRTQAPPQRVRT
ncbi:hypothetical protein BT96DRAFT_921250 [Gymnopus androsaceus JB14]|uniref:Uncharacterized protein n=1 Tax=Gymnopus androsaceus JB14 TaxID=1447944 RepID=A0A6A4HGQ0_9AGAR|nr:hypothetical protein BT96DRAFT_928020 [Gymnopus androsaceus JB14]KAE9397812.1 hypothetical protein BT96DRAFT_921250 [Gymnopus androsaceus JB14]